MGKIKLEKIIVCTLGAITLFLSIMLFNTINDYNLLVDKYNTTLDNKNKALNNISEDIKSTKLAYYDLITKYDISLRVADDLNYEYTICLQNLHRVDYLLQDMNYLNVLNKFYKDNDYNLQTNNCVHQSLAFEEIIELQGYEFTPIRIDNKYKELGHMLGYIKIYIDPVSGRAMSHKDFLNKFGSEYYVAYEEITSDNRLEEIIRANINTFGHVR